ncbi:MAG TPA: hypothetical protein VKS44_13395 [Candidatus Acidoferrales bacterium]|nr:hypothetical protein [Candidatus Acidoferrales bacterium]
MYGKCCREIAREATPEALIPSFAKAPHSESMVTITRTGGAFPVLILRSWILALILLLLVAIFPVQSRAAGARQHDRKTAHAPHQSVDKSDAPQDASKADHTRMAGMQNGSDVMSMHPENFEQEIVHHATDGTSAQPDSTPAPMLMTTRGAWSLMFHANVFLVDEQQTSSRGDDKFFSTNWLMPMAQRSLGPGVFTARVMLSLEPATVTDRRYPLLFQQGETAFGVPIVDGQHPHDFIMELAALYDLKLGEKSLLSFYFAPTGDPAIGPAAFPHRASASENPVATLGHHQEDSTHIASDVATVGLTYGMARIEASGFHGREPDEFRWDIDSGKIDSWSMRLTLQPGKDWSGQYSYARITSPEALSPSEDQARMTASIMYNRPLHDGNWASTILWGRTNSLQDHSIFNSYLLESTWRFRTRNDVWTRIENVTRSNELLLGEQPLPSNFQEEPIGRVQAYTFGYDHDFDLVPHLASALGAQFTAYGVADALKTIYGSHPLGVAIFVRLRPFAGMER